MTTRDCTTPDGTQWTCAQAYAGLADGGDVDADLAEAAEEDGEVEVVATPSGGAQTVRLRLAPGWHEALSDDDLARAIDAERE